MTGPDLAAALADPAAVPAELIPEVLGELERVKAALWSRLAVPAAAPVAPCGDGNGIVTDVREVARLVRRSVSWVRKRGHTLPGFHQPGGHGTRVGWARRALITWADGGTCASDT